MRKLTYALILVVMTLLVFSPAYSQETTETPVPDPVVVTEPVETVSNPLDVISTVIQGAIALMLLLAGSVLPKVLQAIQQLKEALEFFNSQNAANARK